MWGVALGLLIASVTSLNVTISIVLQLGEAIAGVATGLASTDVGALQDFGSGIALPVMEDALLWMTTFGCSRSLYPFCSWPNHCSFSVATRLRGGGKTSAAGQAIQLLWIAGITSWITAVLLEGASSFFGV